MVKTIIVSKSKSEFIDYLLSHEPICEGECFGEDLIITETAQFPDGIEIDIKMCGVQFIEGASNLPWTEAVMFHNGGEIQFTEPDDEFFGEYIFEYENKEYVVIVKREGE